MYSKNWKRKSRIITCKHCGFIGPTVQVGNRKLHNCPYSTPLKSGVKGPKTKAICTNCGFESSFNMGFNVHHNKNCKFEKDSRVGECRIKER